MNEFDDLNLDVLVQTGMGAAGPMSVGMTSTPGTTDGTTSVSAGGTGVKKGDPTIPSYVSRKKRRKRR